LRFIVLDLELNQPTRSIIQVGAVTLDLQKETVKPFFDEVADPSERLEPLRDVLIRFWREFKKAGVANRIAAWGQDVEWLVEASRSIGVTPPSNLQVYDFKQIVKFFRAARGESVRSGVGLVNVLNSLDIPFDGQQHNAYDDARMTAELALRFFRDVKWFYLES
jgi:inhibitor of KinA sporulation pathway (predicted exonuclease)